VGAVVPSNPVTNLSEALGLANAWARLFRQRLDELPTLSHGTDSELSRISRRHLLQCQSYALRVQTMSAGRRSPRSQEQLLKFASGRSIRSRGCKSRVATQDPIGDPEI
jgi:hypothetical protein